jgi:tetratricopeptide (TPR) repeat protein/predicted Ser/Thr protein kinase
VAGPAREARTATASTGEGSRGTRTADTVVLGDARGGAREIGPGDCLGRYTLRALIGAGGMGRVYAATDSELGRTIALKLIRPERGASSSARARLLREAQALAVLHHPNVVTVHDVGTEGDHVFVAMELVDGPTLGEWLRAETRSWRAIRDAFLAAGRGLAAAHAAGIVHRDFKPHNAIVGADRVVVVDFGLARAEADAEAEADADAPEGPGAAAPPPDNLHLVLTLTGERVGTPHYMPPEQRAGGAVTAKADQYAFCVALHEALFGPRGASAGAPAPAIRVPRFVAAVIARGLLPEPDDRWPTMEALLAALGRTFWTPRRRRLAAGMAGAAVAVVAALGFTAGRRAAAPDPCLGGEALVAPLWDDAARGRVHDAFRRTGRAIADDTFQRVDAVLRDRLAGWARAHRDNCEATHVRHEQSEAMLDLRARCLGRARTELSALISALEQADAPVVERATRAAGNVADVTRCSDPAAVGAAIAPPPAALAPAVEAVREDTARLSPLFDLGKWKETRAAAEKLVARARGLGYRPALVRALAQLAHVESNTDPDAAIRDLYEVAQLGAEVGDDDVVATTLPWLVFALGYGKDQFDAADAVYRWAAAATARAGKTAARLSGLYGNRAVVLGRRGDHAGALALYQQLIAIETERAGPRSIGVAWAHKSIAEELDAMGRGGEVRSHYQLASELLEAQVGTEHPLVGSLQISRGWNLINRFEFAAAAPLFEHALGIYEQNLGRDDPRVAGVLYGLGVARLGERRLPQARSAVERAIAIHRAKEPKDGRSVAQEYEVLGDIARKQGNLREALELARRALAVKLAVLGPGHEEVGLTYRLEADHLLALGRTADARAAIDQALAIDEKARGKDHPEVGWALLVRGDVLRAQRLPREAIAAYERSLQILEKTSGAAFPGLCQPLSRLTQALVESGDPGRARALGEHAVALAQAAPADDAAAAQFRLAQAEWALGGDRPGALARARQARARLAALPFPSEDLPRVERWLASVK